MDTLLRIGNDWVDLRRDRWVGKSATSRFLNRIASLEERAWILSASVSESGLSEADRRTALVWASKEAAYKVLSKRSPGENWSWQDALVRPPRFETLPTMGGAESEILIRGDLSLSVRWDFHPEGILAICTSAEHGACGEVRSLVLPDPSAEELASLAGIALSEEESASCHSESSVRVRQLAKRTAREWGLGELQIVRKRESDGDFGPPLALSRSPEDLPGFERPCEGLDLSLSHDGSGLAVSWTAVNGFPASPGLRRALGAKKDDRVQLRST